MNPEWQNPIQRTVRTGVLIIVHNCRTQHSTEHVAVLIIFPLNLQTSITDRVDVMEFGLMHHYELKQRAVLKKSIVVQFFWQRGH